MIEIVEIIYSLFRISLYTVCVVYVCVCVFYETPIRNTNNAETVINHNYKEFIYFVPLELRVASLKR